MSNAAIAVAGLAILYVTALVAITVIAASTVVLASLITPLLLPARAYSEHRRRKRVAEEAGLKTLRRY